MREYSAKFKELYQLLIASDLPVNEPIYLEHDDSINVGGTYDYAFVKFNEKRAYWEMRGNHNVQVKDNAVWYTIGGHDFDLDWSYIDPMMEYHSSHKKYCDYYIEATKKLLSLNIKEEPNKQKTKTQKAF